MSLFRRERQQQLVDATNVPYSLEWQLPKTKTTVCLRSRVLRDLAREVARPSGSRTGLLIGLGSEKAAKKQVWIEGYECIEGKPPETWVESIAHILLRRAQVADSPSPVTGFYFISDNTQFKAQLPDLQALRRFFLGKIAVILVVNAADAPTGSLFAWNASTDDTYGPIVFPFSPASLKRQGYRPFTPYYLGQEPWPKMSDEVHNGELAQGNIQQEVSPLAAVTGGASEPLHASVRWALTGNSSAWQATETSVANSPLPRASTSPVLMHGNPPPYAVTWRTLLPLLCLVTLAAATLGWQLSKTRQAPLSESAASEEARTDLNLQVKRSGTDLQIFWNRNSPSIQAAASGTLVITDGEHRTNMTLDREQLRTTNVLYIPRSREIAIRFDVLTLPENRSVHETLRVIQSSQPMEGLTGTAHSSSDFLRFPSPSLSLPGRSWNQAKNTASPQNSGSADGGQNTPASEPARTAVLPPAPAPASEQPGSGVIRLAPSAPPMPVSSPLPETLDPPRLPPGGNADAGPTVPQQSIVKAEQRAEVPANPVTAGPEPQATAPKPLTSQFSPPVIVKQTPIVLPAALKAIVKTDTIVALTLSIDANGQVTRINTPAEIGLRYQLVELAKRAAAQWKYSPARLGGKAIDSELVVRFKFNGRRM